MNEYITPEIDLQFRIAGCTRLFHRESNDVHYAHHGTHLYLRCATGLPGDQLKSVRNGSEIVIVVLDGYSGSTI